jgi:hypothetical protein
MPTPTQRHPLAEIFADKSPSKACDLEQAFDRPASQPKPEQRRADFLHRLTSTELATEYRR